VFRKMKLIFRPEKNTASPSLIAGAVSCPVLFAWNGHEYEFIADMIGPGVVGTGSRPANAMSPIPMNI